MQIGIYCNARIYCRWNDLCCPPTADKCALVYNFFFVKFLKLKYKGITIFFASLIFLFNALVFFFIFFPLRYQVYEFSVVFVDTFLENRLITLFYVILFIFQRLLPLFNFFLIVESTFLIHILEQKHHEDLPARSFPQLFDNRCYRCFMVFFFVAFS